jgi:hypothetical protein
MAGPVASVLLRLTLTQERMVGLRRGIAQSADTMNGHDFWVNRRPFILSMGPEYPEEISEISDAGLSLVLGWRPEDLVRFAAMCNGDEDHRLLAALCIQLAEQEEGIIDFGGYLPVGPNLDDATPENAVRVENPAGLRGVLLATSLSHYGDVSFTRSWLQHPRFHMVK